MIHVSLRKTAAFVFQFLDSAFRRLGTRFLACVSPPHCMYACLMPPECVALILHAATVFFRSFLENVLCLDTVWIGRLSWIESDVNPWGLTSCQHGG